MLTNITFEAETKTSGRYRLLLSDIFPSDLCITVRDGPFWKLREYSYRFQQLWHRWLQLLV